MTQQSATPLQTARSHPPSLWAYGWWAVTGALLGIGIIGLLTIGVFVLPIAIALILAGVLWAPLRNHAAVALVGGLAAAPLYLAWLNRGGPGDVCETIKDVTTCSEKWSPWPFLAAALILIFVSIGLAVWARRK